MHSRVAGLSVLVLFVACLVSRSSYLPIYFIYVAAAFGAVFTLELLHRRGRVRCMAWADGALVVAAFFAMPAISVLWSTHPDLSRFGHLHLLAGLLVFAIHTRQSEAFARRTLTRLAILLPWVILAYCLAVLALYGSVRKNHLGALFDLDTGRHISATLAIFGVLCAPFLLWGLRHARRRLACAAGLVAVLAVVVLCQSRSAWLALALALVLPAMTDPDKFGARCARTLAVGGVCLALLAGISLAPEGRTFVAGMMDRFNNRLVVDPIGTIANPINSEGKVSRRAAMYAASIDLVRRLPILGPGYGAIPELTQANWGFRESSHSLLATAYGEMGLPGLAAMLAVFGWAMLRLRRAIRDPRGDAATRAFASAVMVALVVIFVHAQFQPVYDNPMLAILLGHASLMGRAAGRSP